MTMVMRPVSKTLDCRSLPTVQGVIRCSTGGRPFKLRRDESANARMSSRINEVDLRNPRDGRYDKIDTSKNIAKVILAVVVDRSDLVSLSC
jgi:hypothetical protein